MYRSRVQELLNFSKERKNIILSLAHKRLVFSYQVMDKKDTEGMPFVGGFILVSWDYFAILNYDL